MIKWHNQGDLQLEESIWACGSKELEIKTMETAWWEAAGMLAETGKWKPRAYILKYKQEAGRMSWE